MEASRWVGALVEAKAFDTVYQRFGDWQSKAPTFAALAANPEHLSLREEAFTEITAWNDTPSELAFLSRCSIADLLNADSHLPDESYLSRTLARAYLIMGSKDNQE